LIRKTLAWVMPVLIMTGISLAQEGEEQVEKKVEKNPIVEIQTNYGNIYLEVFKNETPIHATNFLSKVDEGKYDSLTFHRVVKGFVIQGGNPLGTGMGSMGPDRLPDEEMPAPPEVRGTVAMARSREGASNCQFYINLADHTKGNKTDLDGMGFTSFARVVQGMDVVDKIGAVETTGDRNETPVKPVYMFKLSRVESIPEMKEGE
jgi:cyclophilin family peptidyl-prolyl cis-trans isomerase